MLPSSKNSGVGIEASSRENKSCRSNSSEPIMPSGLLNTTSMSTVVTAPGLIPFMGASLIKSPGLICLHSLPYKQCQVVEHYLHSQMQQSMMNTVA